jgi:hypothetical protein
MAAPIMSNRQSAKSLSRPTRLCDTSSTAPYSAAPIITTRYMAHVTRPNVAAATSHTKASPA